MQKPCGQNYVNQLAHCSVIISFHMCPPTSDWELLKIKDNVLLVIIPLCLTELRKAGSNVAQAQLFPGTHIAYPTPFCLSISHFGPCPWLVLSSKHFLVPACSGVQGPSPLWGHIALQLSDQGRRRMFFNP